MDKETGIWTLEEAKKRHRYDPKLAQAMYNMFYPHSVADIGCGTGMYCKFFKELGCEVVNGYEGTQDVKSIAVYDDIMFIDLTKKRVVGLNYDLVLCLEVGEHIPLGFEQTFIDNVAAFTSQYLVLSWAIPGQGGLGHFNEKSNEDVISELAKRGLLCDLYKSERLRSESTLKWFKNTVMVFSRYVYEKGSLR